MKQGLTLLFGLLIYTFSIASTDPGSVSVAEVSISTDRAPEICLGEDIRLTAVTDENADSIRWTPTVGLSNPQGVTTIAQPQSTTTYTVTAYFPGGEVQTAEVEILVDKYYFPNLIADTTICEGQSITLAASVPESNTVYVWTPADSLNNDSIANPTASPTEDVTYVLVATSENGFCDNTDSVIVTVNPAKLDLGVGDTVFICKGEEYQFSIDARPNPGDIIWNPTDSLTPTTGPNVTVETDRTITYAVSLVTPDGCELFDTVTVRVDSLPEFEITAVPGPKQPCNKYCPMETVAMFTMPADPIKFPDITYEWSGDEGTILDSLYTTQNTVIETRTTLSYIRTNTNNACEETDTILIEVVDPSVMINVSDTAVCAGFPVQIDIDETDLSDFEWGPEDAILPPVNFSCTDCPDPVITIGNKGEKIAGGELVFTFTFSATKEECCPVNATVIIEIIEEVIPGPSVVTCPGIPVNLNITDPRINSIEWTPTDGLSCSDCPNPIATVNETTVYTFCGQMDDECTFLGNALVSVFPPPTSQEIELEFVEVAVGGSTGAILVVDPTPSDTNNVKWFVNGLEQAATGLNVNLEILNEGENEICAIYIDANGCERKTAVVIVIGVEPMYAIPKAFTPNGDMTNDYFVPVVTNANEFEESFIKDFKVFNRWGEKVYDNDDNEQGWDGQYKGQPAPSEVYVYIIEIELPSGSNQIFKGDVTLLR